MLKDVLNQSILTAKHIKGKITADAREDLDPLIHVYRGSDPVALILLGDHLRENILDAAILAAGGFDADVVSATFETYAVPKNDNSIQINPLTGHEWRAGELQEAVDKHDGIAKGWVKEMIVVAVASRAGDSAAAYIDFSYQESAFSAKPSLCWGPTVTETSLDGHAPRGYMHERLVAAMSTPSGSVALGGDLSREERDLATAQAIQSTLVCQVMLFAAGDDTTRLEFLRDFGAVLKPWTREP